MLQAFGFVVHFIPGKIENIVQESLEQAMMALNFQSPPLTQFREDNSVVLLIFHERWAFGGKLLEHSGNRGRPHLQVGRQSAARDPFTGGTAQYQNRFEVIVDSLRGFRSH